MTHEGGRAAAGISAYALSELTVSVCLATIFSPVHGVPIPFVPAIGTAFPPR